MASGRLQRAAECRDHHMGVLRLHRSMRAGLLPTCIPMHDRAYKLQRSRTLTAIHTRTSSYASNLMPSQIGGRGGVSAASMRVSARSRTALGFISLWRVNAVDAECMHEPGADDASPLSLFVYRDSRPYQCRHLVPSSRSLALALPPVGLAPPYRHSRPPTGNSK